MTFGQRLRLLRKCANKTQKKIHDETGIAQATLSDWENSRSEPTVSDLFKLAPALGLTVAELVEPDKRKEES